MKLRIVKKQMAGFEPYYELQQKFFIIWGLIGWSTDLKVIENTRDSMLKNEKASKPSIIWSN